MAHDKLKYVRKTREAIDSFLCLPLPNINPNIISGLSVLTSLFFILALKYSSALAFIFIIITILLDWFDGLIAKKYKKCSEEGYIVDVTSDRLSEGIIFAPFFIPWFYLFVLNNILTIFSFTKNRHIILPIRHVFLIYFLLYFVF
jgi:phosphatidylglycerophosphate synthase